MLDRDFDPERRADAEGHVPPQGDRASTSPRSSRSSTAATPSRSPAAGSAPACRAGSSATSASSRTTSSPAPAGSSTSASGRVLAVGAGREAGTRAGRRPRVPRSTATSSTSASSRASRCCGSATRSCARSRRARTAGTCRSGASRRRSAAGGAASRRRCPARRPPRRCATRRSTRRTTRAPALSSAEGAAALAAVRAAGRAPAARRAAPRRLVRRRLEALAWHPDLEVRCLAYRTLLLDEPSPGYGDLLASFVESGQPFLNEASIEAIARARPEAQRLEALRAAAARLPPRARVARARTPCATPSRTCCRSSRRSARAAPRARRARPRRARGVGALRRGARARGRARGPSSRRWPSGAAAPPRGAAAPALRGPFPEEEVAARGGARRRLLPGAVGGDGLRRAGGAPWRGSGPAGSGSRPSPPRTGTGCYRASFEGTDGRHRDLLLALRGDVADPAVEETMLWMIALGDPPGRPGRRAALRLRARPTSASSPRRSWAASPSGRRSGSSRRRASRATRRPPRPAVPLRARARGVLRRLAGERRADPARADRPDERRRARAGLPVRRPRPLARRLAPLRGPGLARRADAPPLPRAGGRALPGAARAARPAVDRRGRGRGPRRRGGAPLPRRAPRRRARAPPTRTRSAPSARPSTARTGRRSRSTARSRDTRRWRDANPKATARGPPAARGPDAAALRARGARRDRAVPPVPPHLLRRRAGGGARALSTGCSRACSSGRGSRRRASSSSRRRRPRSPAPTTGAPSASSSSRDAATLQEAEVAARAGQGAGLRALPRHGRRGHRYTVREPTGPAEIGRLYRLLSESGLQPGGASRHLVLLDAEERVVGGITWRPAGAPGRARRGDRPRAVGALAAARGAAGRGLLRAPRRARATPPSTPTSAPGRSRSPRASAWTAGGAGSCASSGPTRRAPANGSPRPRRPYRGGYTGDTRFGVGS